MTVPNTFANATTAIPLVQLDQNFNTGVTLGNTTVYLGNTTTALGNVTLNAPTFTTPTLGAATATSINFGQTTLNYYGEGTFTPSVGGTATYSNQGGKYTRVGRFVWCDVNLGITAIGTGSATTVSGMPFSLGTTPDGNGPVGRFTSLATPIVVATAQWGQGGSTVTFMTQTITGTSNTTNDTILGSGTTIRFSVAGST